VQDTVNSVNQTLTRAFADILASILPAVDNSTQVMDLTDGPADVRLRISQTTYTTIDIVCPDDT
jgi:hypothetical protein